jgi:hypothetical protein
MNYENTTFEVRQLSSGICKVTATLENGVTIADYCKENEVFKTQIKIVSRHMMYSLHNVTRKINANYEKIVARQTIKIGDILAGSFGYDCTIPIFYKVIDKKKSKVTLQELRANYVDDSHVVPSENTYGEPFTKIINGLYIHIRSASVTKWDGRPRYKSEY